MNPEAQPFQPSRPQPWLRARLMIGVFKGVGHFEANEISFISVGQIPARLEKGHYYTTGHCATIKSR